MIVICEDCGKKYRVDPLKITGTKAKFKCKSCGHIITITKPDETFEKQEPKSVHEQIDKSQ